MEDRILIHGWMNLGSGRQDTYSQLGELGQWKTGYLLTAGLTEAVEDRILIHNWVNWGSGRRDTYSQLG